MDEPASRLGAVVRSLVDVGQLGMTKENAPHNLLDRSIGWGLVEPTLGGKMYTNFGQCTKSHQVRWSGTHQWEIRSELPIHKNGSNRHPFTLFSYARAPTHTPIFCVTTLIGVNRGSLDSLLFRPKPNGRCIYHSQRPKRLIYATVTP